MNNRISAFGVKPLLCGSVLAAALLTAAPTAYADQLQLSAYADNSFCKVEQAQIDTNAEGSEDVAAIDKSFASVSNEEPNGNAGPEALPSSNADDGSGKSEASAGQKNNSSSSAANADVAANSSDNKQPKTSKQEAAQTKEATAKPSLSGTAHIQDKGTVKASSSAGGKLALGTTGKAKRLEGVSVKAGGVSGDISYGAHIQNVGWQGEKKNGSFAGTTGRGLQMEAIWIKSTVKGYNVWYRAHIADYGWLGWASNGQKAGSEGLSKRMEALEVILLPIGQTPSSYNAALDPFKLKAVSYSAHVQDMGTLSGFSTSTTGTVTVGTTGKGKRLEGFTVSLAGVSGGISYAAHVQDIGWQSAKSNGTFAGTKGQSKRVEAAKISLTGQLANLYDVFYRAHVSNIGWMAWSKNGANVGTAGLSMPIEAIEIRLVKKGASAPSTNGLAYIDSSYAPSAIWESKTEGSGWSSTKSGSVAGTTGKGKSLLGVGIKLSGEAASIGGISYRAHFANAGWTSWVANGKRDINASNPIQALQIKLTGQLSKFFDVYYRSHVSDYGWMGWSKNGSSSGTCGLSKNAEAYQIKIVAKKASAPGSTLASYLDNNSSRWDRILVEYANNKNVNQLIFVKYAGGSDARVSLYTKNSSGWVNKLNCGGHVGRNGIDKVKEGDKKTPTGTFGITGAFGINSNPGAHISYTKVNKYLYWCGDKAHYNQLIDVRNTPHSCAGEHLIDYSGSYNYGLFLDYNTNPTVYKKGSAIFMHCAKSNATAGCISVSESNMISIIRNITSGAKICVYRA